MRHPVFHFFLFSDHFSSIFSILQSRQYIFCFFIVLTFCSDMLFTPSSSPWLTFLFFLRIILLFSHLLTFFYSFSLFFTPYRHFFISFSPFAASLTCFFAFLPRLTIFTSFQPFFSFLSSFLSFFAVFLLFRHFTPSFCHFSAFPLFLRSTYVTLPGSFFTFRIFQNVSRETSFFTIFGLHRSVSGDLLFLFPKITLVFCLSNF